MSKKLDKLQAQLEQLKAREQALRARTREQERKARTRRLIQLGAVVESAAGEVTQENAELLVRQGLVVMELLGDISPNRLRDILQGLG